MTTSIKAPKIMPKARTAARSREQAAQPYHHGNLRATLLDTAEGLLGLRGLQGLTLREVAKAAGVSHGAPYHHFAGLDALLVAVAERGFLILGDAMAEAVAVPDTRERLLRVAHAYVDCARAHPERFRLMFGPMLARKEDYPDFKRAAERAFGFVLAAADAHDKQHGASLALAGWSLAHGLSHLLIDGAFDGLPIRKQNPDGLARKLSERLFG